MMTGRRVFVIFLLLLGAALPLHSQENPEPLFAEAYQQFSSGHFSQAKELFLETVDRDFLLEDHSLYFLGAATFSTAENERAREFFARLRSRFPESIWSSAAGLQLAKIALAEDDLPTATRWLEELRAQKSPKDILEEALYLLGDIHGRRGDLRSAFSLFQEVRSLSPLSSRAQDARRKVEHLREQSPELFALTTPQDLAEEGELLLRERRYAQAERMFRKAQDAISRENPLRPRLLIGLANVHRGTRDLAKGMATLNEILQDHPQSAEASEALYRVARTLWNRDQNQEALQRFQEFTERYPARRHADFAHLAAARIQDSSGKPEEALRIYGEIPRRYPGSSLRAVAAWNSVWIHYLQGDYGKAESGFQEIASSPWGENYHTAALYWQGRAAEKGGKLDAAAEIYRTIADRPDISYYTGLAERRLEKMGRPLARQKSVAAPMEPSPIRYGDGLFHLNRARKLAEISLNQLAKAELDAIKPADQDLDLKFILAREYSRIGAHDRSVPLAIQIPGFSEELARHRYPLAYWDLIQEKSREHGLDPHLVLALIRQESLFNHTAVSSASALGLMQIIPATAKRVAAAIGLRRPDPDKLFDPALNVTLGVSYLKDLLDRYSDSLPKAIAAYNAGENAVDRWEQQLKAEDEDEFVEQIPYGETRLYVKLVLRNYLSYRSLYQKNP